MQIGPYTFEEFKQKAAEFHGYPAPGILLGGYMVELAKQQLPAGTLFEALVETRKCLPDAVQLLTLCSTGNGWMRILDLGRYALSLYDKRSGEGVRVGLSPEKLRDYPELNAWFMKLKPKQEQDSALLLREIEAAGDSVCSLTPIRVQDRFLGKGPSSPIAVCPVCREAFPASDGLVCRGCQGENPYCNDVTLAANFGASTNFATLPDPAGLYISILPVEEAVGQTILHDMTEVIPGESKGAAFSAGQRLGAGDVCRLQKMGRFSVAVTTQTPVGFIHENAGAEALARRMAGAGLEYSLPPREGKINFRARQSGLFTLDRARLLAFNLLPDVMCATRQDGVLVQAGAEVAGTRVIPLYISQERLAAALEILGNQPLFSIAPLRRAKVGILVTGSEVFQGLVEDKFIPIVSAKVESLGSTVVKTVIAPDKSAAIAQAIAQIREAGADLLITTGGMSVDPGDITRAALLEAGLQDMLYSAPVLPGTMSLVGMVGSMQVIGVPACALYHKITLFDALLPRLLAGRQLSRADLAALGEGGFCVNCPVCSWPKCTFMT